MKTKIYKTVRRYFEDGRVVLLGGLEVITLDYRSKYPSSMLLRAGVPVRITTRPRIWGMPCVKYRGNIEPDKDGRIYDVTGEFYRIRIRKAPASAKDWEGRLVYFAAKRLVLLPSKRRL